jgi:hypothetical protein
MQAMQTDIREEEKKTRHEFMKGVSFDTTRETDRHCEKSVVSAIWKCPLSQATRG